MALESAPFWLLLSLHLLLSPASCQSRLTAVDAQPCRTYAQSVGRYNSDIFTVFANTSLCLANSTAAFRVESYSGQSIEQDPIVFTVRQGSGVISWTLPFTPQGFSIPFLIVNRTLCPTTYSPVSGPLARSRAGWGEVERVLDEDILFFVDVFSSSNVSVDYNLTVVPVDNYILSLDETFSVTIGASAPQIMYFRFPNDTESVTVQASTDNDRCAIVSVQNYSCPANDLLKNALSKGDYQTMSTDAFLTIRGDHVKNREFLVVLIATNYSVCHSSRETIPFVSINSTYVDPYEQMINITIRELQSASQMGLSIVAPVLVFIFCYVIGLVMAFGCIPCFHWYCLLQCRWVWGASEDGGAGLEDEKMTPLLADQSDPEAGRTAQVGGASDQESVPLMSGERTRDTYGGGATDIDSGALTGSMISGGILNESGNSNQGQHDESGIARDTEGVFGRDSIQISAMYDREENISVSRLSKIRPEVLAARYEAYGWETITVGIFYGLPAFQLVLSEQVLVNISGNQDFCFYNFKCAHPLGILSAFNNIWSNIGYVMFGVLFLIIVIIRHVRYKIRREKNKNYVDNHGIPQFFGMFYAMGVGLIIEGFMSALYHICPTNANFQFDTAFMFIIGGLLLVKTFQNRHPDIHANSFLAFFSFAVVVFFALIGIKYDSRNPIAIRVTLFTIVLLLVGVFFISFYYFHHWRLRPDTLKRICNGLKTIFSTCPNKDWMPSHKIRFVKLLGGFIFNVGLAIITIVAGKFHALDIATAILAFFLLNVVYFLVVYTLQKWWYREPWTVLPLVMAIGVGVLWGAAFVFFYQKVYNSQLLPAESRELNDRCILFGFYDNHDVWHMLSAASMFVSFMFVLTIDDGLTDVKRTAIRVF